MTVNFTCIQDFIDSNPSCRICNHGLNPILTFLPGSTVTGFKLQTTTLQIEYFLVEYVIEHVLVTTYIFIKNNMITISHDSDEKISIYNKKKYLNYFQHVLKPRIELQCNNKKCKSHYYLCSDYLSFSTDLDSIVPFCVTFEFFKLGRFAILNDWEYLVSNIYPAIADDEGEVSPIKIPIYNLMSSDNNKLLNRIKTLVTFS